MLLERLRVRNFRNLGSQDLAFPPAGAAVIGDNAQGKTNLLEAIYYLEIFRSFRGAPDPDLPAFSEDGFFLSGSARPDSQSDDSVQVQVSFDGLRGRKRVQLNGRAERRMIDALGRLATVAISPRDSALVTSGPSERRRFLDVLLSLNVPGYVGYLRDFRRALAHRNGALRAGEREAAVRIWDEPLARNGTEVASARARWVRDHGDAFSSIFRDISGGDEAFLVYRSHLCEKEPSRGDARPRRDRFRELLDRNWRKDLKRRATTRGPHRDDLHLRIRKGDKDASLRSFGSGGQQKTAAIALRLAEAETIRAERRTKPIVLLDDAFAELDEGRARRVVRRLGGARSGQVLYTAPRESDARLFGDGLERWSIRDGRVETPAGSCVG